MKGEKIKTLINGSIISGNHTVLWNGDDDSGIVQSSGIYLCRLRNGKHSSNIKLNLIK